MTNTKIVNVMIDLETLDNKVGAVITQLGAVEFDIRTGENKRTFSANIDAASCQKKGMTIGADTVMWWLTQSLEARQSLLTPCPQDVTIVLNQFREWLLSLIAEPGVQVRGSGSPKIYFWCHASFDLPILTRAFELCDIPVVWGYRDYMDLRTISRLASIRVSDYQLQDADIAHNATSDCIMQIRYAVAAYNKTKPELNDPDISP